MAKRRIRLDWILIAALVGVFVVGSVWSREQIPWQTDVRQSGIDAKNLGKSRLLYFTASWCGPCQQMKRTTWASKEVAAALKDYIPVKVDADEYTAMGSQYKINLIPAFVLVDNSGKAIKQASGYMSASEFIDWLKAPE